MVPPFVFKLIALVWGWGMTAAATASMLFALWNLYWQKDRFNAEVAWCALVVILGLALAFFRRIGRAVLFGDVEDDFVTLKKRVWRPRQENATLN